MPRPKRRIHINLFSGRHIISIDGSALTSNLKEPGDYQYNAAIDGIESLLLALHTEGIGVYSPAFVRAIETAVESAANQIVDNDAR